MSFWRLLSEQVDLQTDILETAVVKCENRLGMDLTVVDALVHEHQHSWGIRKRDLDCVASWG